MSYEGMKKRLDLDIRITSQQDDLVQTCSRRWALEALSLFLRLHFIYETRTMPKCASLRLRVRSLFHQHVPRLQQKKRISKICILYRLWKKKKKKNLSLLCGFWQGGIREIVPPMWCHYLRQADLWLRKTSSIRASTGIKHRPSHRQLRN